MMTNSDAESLVELDRHQLPRLQNMRLSLDRKQTATSIDLLSLVRADLCSRSRSRDANRRAITHWFLKGSALYSNHKEQHKQVIMAQLHSYVEGGGDRYLQHAEQDWQHTLQIEHDGTETARVGFWVDATPPGVRLLPDNQRRRS